MILKTQVSLLTLMAAMVSLSLPAWSMEENHENKRITSASNFLDQPLEIQEKVLSNAVYRGTNMDVKTWAALSLTCRDWHQIVTTHRFLKPHIENAYLEIWENNDEDCARKQIVSIFHVVKRAQQFVIQGKMKEASKLYANALLEQGSLPSSSRLVALNSAILLTKDGSLLSSEKEDIKRAVEGKISVAMDSLRLEVNTAYPQDPHKSRKDEIFLQLYFSLPAIKKSQVCRESPFKFSTETTQFVQKRIEEAKQAIIDNNWMNKNIPACLFRLMGEGRFRDQIFVYDKNQTKLYLKAASDLGDGDASFSLADYYCHGHEGGEDMAQAVLLYKKAVDQGHEKAKIVLDSFKS